MKLTSPAFRDGNPIPERFTAFGAEISPPMTWSGVPSDAKCLVLTCVDLDAPQRPFIHWVVYNIPAQWRGLPEDLPFIEAPLDGVRQAFNDYRTPGWAAPFPPPGRTHEYHFRLLALDCKINEQHGYDHCDVYTALQGHVLDEAELIGTYVRKDSEVPPMPASDRWGQRRVVVTN